MDIRGFWDNVKKILKEKGLTQKQLSTAIGSKPRVIENQIANNAIPNIEETLNICKVLDVSLSVLLGPYVQDMDALDPGRDQDKIFKIKAKVEEISHIIEDN